MTTATQSPHFGRRVVGDAEYEKEAAIAAVGAKHFGPRVIGKAAQEPTAEAPATPYDPRIGPRKPKSGEPKGLSIAALIETLGENPLQFDELYAAELVRAEGPRKGALRALLGFEAEQDEPRPDVVDAISSLLETPKE